MIKVIIQATQRIKYKQEVMLTPEEWAECQENEDDEDVMRRIAETYVDPHRIHDADWMEDVDICEVAEAAYYNIIDTPMRPNRFKIVRVGNWQPTNSFSEYFKTQREAITEIESRGATLRDAVEPYLESDEDE